MDKAKSLLNTLKLAAHCLCEQGYNASNLIKIAGIIAASSGTKSDTAVHEIKRAMKFHADLERRERAERSRAEREETLLKKQEAFFNQLPGHVISETLKICDNSYRKAVEFVAENMKKGDKNT